MSKQVKVTPLQRGIVTNEIFRETIMENKMSPKELIKKNFASGNLFDENQSGDEPVIDEVAEMMNEYTLYIIEEVVKIQKDKSKYLQSTGAKMNDETSNQILYEVKKKLSEN